MARRDDRKRDKGRNGVRYFVDKSGKVRWSAVANGNVVATAGQGYDSKRDARTGMLSAAVQLAKAAFGIKLGD